MTAFDGSPAEMSFPFGDADWLSPDDTTAERLLAGHGAGPDASPDLQALALVLQAAARPATLTELAGEQAAVAAFERVIARPGTRAWLPLARRIPVLVSGGVIAAAAALGGTAAADGLPAPLQQVAHTVFDAPAPHPRAAPSAVPGLAPEVNGGSVAGPSAAVKTNAKGHDKAKPAKSTAKGKAKAHGKAAAPGQAKAHGKGTAPGQAKAHGRTHGHQHGGAQGPPGGHGNNYNHGRQGNGNGHAKGNGFGNF